MRTLLGLLSLAASVYVLLGLMLYLLQARMVFLSDFPGRALTATPEDIGLRYADVEFETTDGERLHGWFVPAGNSRAVVLFFHGNAGNISHRLDSLRIFHDLGLDVLMFDYRGYGRSSGTTSEIGTYLDGEAAWSYLTVDRGFAADRIILFGRSLGGAVAARLGSRHTPAAVIIESTFSSGVDMARRLYPLYPARLVTRLRYPVVAFAARLNCPVLVAHSRMDEIIPFEMGQAIFAAARQPKAFLQLRGDHNNGFLLTGEAYVAGLEAFINSVFPPENQKPSGLQP